MNVTWYRWQVLGSSLYPTLWADFEINELNRSWFNPPLHSTLRVWYCNPAIVRQTIGSPSFHRWLMELLVKWSHWWSLDLFCSHRFQSWNLFKCRVSYGSTCESLKIWGVQLYICSVRRQVLAVIPTHLKVRRSSRGLAKDIRDNLGIGTSRIFPVCISLFLILQGRIVKRMLQGTFVSDLTAKDSEASATRSVCFWSYNKGQWSECYKERLFLILQLRTVKRVLQGAFVSDLTTEDSEPNATRNDCFWSYN